MCQKLNLYFLLFYYLFVKVFFLFIHPFSLSVLLHFLFFGLVFYHHSFSPFFFTLVFIPVFSSYDFTTLTCLRLKTLYVVYVSRKQLFRSPSSGLSFLPQSTPEPLFSSFLLSFYQSLFFFLFTPFRLVFYCIFYFLVCFFIVIHFLPSFLPLFYPYFSAHMISSLVYSNLLEIKKVYMLYLYM
jgi:hypothetical protein